MLATVLALVALTSSASALQFLQITDIHSDPEYLVTSPASYSCREDDEQAEKRAYFGRYGCDSPASLIQLMFSKIKSTHPDPPFIIATGDFAGHGLTQLGESVVQEAVTETANLFRKNFPNSAILQAFGNNDAYRHNQVPLEAEKASFYDFFFQATFAQNQAVKQHLTVAQYEQLQRTYLLGGYYEYPVSDSLKVIVLNTNYFHVSNHLSNDRNAPNAQLTWMRDRLRALGDDQQAIICGHIVPGFYYQDQQFWNSTYVQTFSSHIFENRDKIIAYISAHTHHGDLRSMQDPNAGFIFNWFQDEAAREPYLAIAIAPAISPVYSNNPGYRAYTLDGQAGDYMLKSYNDCFLNLNKTIERSTYSPRRAQAYFEFCYDSSLFIEDLKPQTISDFNLKLYDNETLASLWAQSKSGYIPGSEEGEAIIKDQYEKNEILSVPRSEWNKEFLCYSRYTQEGGYRACLSSS